MVDTAPPKACQTCNKTKALSDFPRSGHWHLKTCRDCRNEGKRLRDVEERAVVNFDRDLMAVYPEALAPVSDLERYVAQRSACRGLPWWFNQDRPGVKTTWRQKTVCESCPVIKECRDVCDLIEGELGHKQYDRDYLVGFWAGETITDRCRRRSARVLQAAQAA